jgi:hypothetical protein
VISLAFAAPADRRMGGRTAGHPRVWVHAASPGVGTPGYMNAAPDGAPYAEAGLLRDCGAG